MDDPLVHMIVSQDFGELMLDAGTGTWPLYTMAMHLGIQNPSTSLQTVGWAALIAQAILK